MPSGSTCRTSSSSCWVPACGSARRARCAGLPWTSGPARSRSRRPSCARARGRTGDPGVPEDHRGRRAIALPAFVVDLLQDRRRLRSGRGRALGPPDRRPPRARPPEPHPGRPPGARGDQPRGGLGTAAPSLTLADDPDTSRRRVVRARVRRSSSGRGARCGRPADLRWCSPIGLEPITLRLHPRVNGHRWSRMNLQVSPGTRGARQLPVTSSSRSKCVVRASQRPG